MAWTFLFVAGLLEVGWAVALKTSEGFSKPIFSILTLALLAASVFLLGLSLRHLPLGTAYGVWTGIGAIGTVLVGMIWMGDGLDWRRLFCVGLIAAGIVGLKILTPVVEN